MAIVSLSNAEESEGAPARFVAVREIRGDEEVADLSAHALASRLIVAGSVPQDRLSLADQDRIMAEIYRAIYGAVVECHVPCPACGKRFEMTFDLDDWMATLTLDPGADVRAGPEGTFVLEGAGQGRPIRFRLPREADLMVVTGLTADRAAEILRTRCVLEGDPNDARLEAVMARVGPLLDDQIETACAYCGHEQSVAFNLSDFLIASIARERPLINREIHQLARAYHWSRPDILAMPRSSRRQHVRLILEESDGGRASW